MSDPRIEAIKEYTAAASDHPLIEIHRWRSKLSEFHYTQICKVGEAEPVLPESFSPEFIAAVGLECAGRMSRDEINRRLAVFQSDENL